MTLQNSRRSRLRSLMPLWIGLALLAVLSPLGLIAQGTAWGEWGGEEFDQILSENGFAGVPAGMEQFGSIWSSPLPDYSIPGFENATVGYIVSALLGMAIIVAITFVLGKMVARKEEADV